MSGSTLHPSSKKSAAPNTIYLTPHQKQRLKETLQKERSYWEGIQHQITENLQKRVGHLSSDAADVANQEIEVKFAVRGREGRMLKKIETALKRIETDTGQYGLCDECGTQIGFERLEVRPTATLCYDCKTRSEMRKKQMSSD